MAYINLASIRECTESEGPGKRFALWCQGCSRSCKKCCNPEMQPLVKNKIIDCNDIIGLINNSKQKYNIEGVSLIGGEPFLQAQGLAYVAEWCHKNKLSVLIFSGFTLEQIQKNNIKSFDKLLQYTDILVDGLFVDELYDKQREWVGSTNQRVILLSEFYKQGIEFQNNERSMEICISGDKFAINGWPF